MDNKKKSLVKTFTWRILAVTISLIVAYLFTKQISTSFWLALTANVVSMIAYYVHERMWAKYE